MLLLAVSSFTGIRREKPVPACSSSTVQLTESIQKLLLLDVVLDKPSQTDRI